MSTIVKQDKSNVEAIQKLEPGNPGHLLEMAINKDLDIEKLTKLMELQRTWQSDQARKAFFSALNEFQANVPEIRKAKKVGFETKTGGRTDYNYAPLADIVRQIKDTCKECGLSYRWEIQDTKEELKVTCKVTHLDGHTEETTMLASPDTSGSKNPIQARGSAIEYLKRYTLIGALGLSTADTDIDGQLPEIDIDILHKQYMSLYDKLVSMDKGYSTKAHPDNWKGERTQKIYIAAIGQARKLIASMEGQKA
jgi:hypothetical protein